MGGRLRAMNEAQRHRGPDGEGYFLDGSTNSVLFHDEACPSDQVGACGLAHRRLAILDPARGLQPMQSRDGRLTVLLNGEIYNFESLKRRVKTYPFQTDCDTEILLALYRESPDRPEQWLQDLDGIFAFALWDHDRKRLLLARDPFGVKPLHVVQGQDELLFASEIKSLLAAGIPARLNRSALHAFMNVRYVPGLDTLFEGVDRFPPGHFAWVEAGRLSETTSFYRLPDASEPSFASPEEVIEPIRKTYREAVESQLLSDVPVGVSLSGGLDSSMNAAEASRAYRETRSIRSGDQILRTFTVGFGEPTDEIEDARLIAERYQTQHTEQMLENRALNRMPEVIRAVEEPKINILQGYQLYEVVQRHVKVLLSGLGGDELFAGYDIHRYCNRLGFLHGPLMQALQPWMAGPLSRGGWAAHQAILPRRLDQYRMGGQILLSGGDPTQFYLRLRNAWDMDRGAYDWIYAKPDEFRALPSIRSRFEPTLEGSGSVLTRVLRTEFQTKMVNDFLLNEDRVSSAHGVESRVPFLNRELVELAFRIPDAWKMRGSETKVLWKQAAAKELPTSILKKKKQGFTFSSYHQWGKDLRSAVAAEENREWCEDTGLFNYGFIRDVLEAPPHPHLRWHYFMVWMMLGFKHWQEIFDVEV